MRSLGRLAGREEKDSGQHYAGENKTMGNRELEGVHEPDHELRENQIFMKPRIPEYRDTQMSTGKLLRL